MLTVGVPPTGGSSSSCDGPRGRVRPRVDAGVVRDGREIERERTVAGVLGCHRSWTPDTVAADVPCGDDDLVGDADVVGAVATLSPHSFRTPRSRRTQRPRPARWRTRPVSPRWRCCRRPTPRPGSPAWSGSVPCPPAAPGPRAARPAPVAERRRRRWRAARRVRVRRRRCVSVTTGWQVCASEVLVLSGSHAPRVPARLPPVRPGRPPRGILRGSPRRVCGVRHTQGVAGSTGLGSSASVQRRKHL